MNEPVTVGEELGARLRLEPDLYANVSGYVGYLGMCQPKHTTHSSFHFPKNTIYRFSDFQKVLKIAPLSSGRKSERN